MGSDLVEFLKVLPSLVTTVIALAGANAYRRLRTDGVIKTTHSLLDDERVIISDFTSFSQECETDLVPRVNEISDLVTRHVDQFEKPVYLDKSKCGDDLRRLRKEAARLALRLEQQVITDMQVAEAGRDYARELDLEFQDLRLALYGPSPDECHERLNEVRLRRHSKRYAVRDRWIEAARVWRERHMVASRPSNPLRHMRQFLMRLNAPPTSDPRNVRAGSATPLLPPRASHGND